MNTTPKRRAALAAGVLLLAFAAGNAAAATFDLAADWSDIANPNGAWSLNQGTRALPSTPGWVAGQDAWADAAFADAGHVPVWLQAQQGFIDVFGGDVAIGDIVVHGRCCSDLLGDAGGQANVTWTSGVSGLATISGSTWYLSTLPRNVDWNLYVNGILVTAGNVGASDPYDRASPFDLATGSGGAGALSFATAPGDTVTFEVRRGAGSGADHFVGVNLSIDVQATAVAAPQTLALLALGLAGLAPRRRAARG